MLTSACDVMLRPIWPIQASQPGVCRQVPAGDRQRVRQLRGQARPLLEGHWYSQHPRQYFGPFLAHFAPRHYPPRAVRGALLGAYAHRMLICVLIGAWDPMV